MNSLPDINLKMIEIPAYGIFVLYVLRTAFDWSLKLIARKAEKNCNGKNEKKAACVESVPWALHSKTTEDLKLCAEKTVDLQQKTLVALHRLADAGEAQATAIQGLGEKLGKLP